MVEIQTIPIESDWVVCMAEPGSETGSDWIGSDRIERIAAFIVRQGEAQ